MMVWIWYFPLKSCHLEYLCWCKGAVQRTIDWELLSKDSRSQFFSKLVWWNAGYKASAKWSISIFNLAPWNVWADTMQQRSTETCQLEPPGVPPCHPMSHISQVWVDIETEQKHPSFWVSQHTAPQHTGPQLQFDAKNLIGSFKNRRKKKNKWSLDVLSIMIQTGFRKSNSLNQQFEPTIRGEFKLTQVFWTRNQRIFVYFSCEMGAESSKDHLKWIDKLCWEGHESSSDNHERPHHPLIIFTHSQNKWNMELKHAKYAPEPKEFSKNWKCKTYSMSTQSTSECVFHIICKHFTLSAKKTHSQPIRPIPSHKMYQTSGVPTQSEGASEPLGSKT